MQAEDVVIALSHSGETEEVLRVLEAIRRIGARLIALTGTTRSTLGQAADVALDCHVERRSVPAEPGADREHDRGAGAGRRAGDERCWCARASRKKTSRTCIRAASLASA